MSENSTYLGIIFNIQILFLLKLFLQFFFYFNDVSKRTSKIVISQHDENFARFCKTYPSYTSYMRNVNSW